MEPRKLEALKQQIVALSPLEQSELARFLAEQQKQDQSNSAPPPLAGDELEAAERKRRQHMEWMLAHREEYAGQYVALDGDRLVGQGRTLAEAHQQAKQNGVHHPFLVRLTSVNEVLFGGW